VQDLPLTYIDTSVISYLTGRQVPDEQITLRQKQTLQWWGGKGTAFLPVVTRLVQEEAEQGAEPYIARRLAVLLGIPVFAVTPEIDGLSRALVQAGALPENSAQDATHIAACAFYNIPFLAPWNFKHIHNERMWAKMEQVCNRFDYPFPSIHRPVLIEENLIYEHTQHTHSIRRGS